jgi:hypothetical protein
MFTYSDFINYHLTFLTESNIFLKSITADVLPYCAPIFSPVSGKCGIGAETCSVKSAQ